MNVLDPDGCIDAWMTTADEAQRQAMMTWLRGVAQGPEACVSLRVRHAKTGRHVYGSQLPGGRCVVTYWWSLAPVRFVRIVKVTPIHVVPDC